MDVICNNDGSHSHRKVTNVNQTIKKKRKKRKNKTQNKKLKFNKRLINIYITNSHTIFKLGTNKIKPLYGIPNWPILEKTKYQ